MKVKIARFPALGLAAAALLVTLNAELKELVKQLNGRINGGVK
jgi:hypothetical protein